MAEAVKENKMGTAPVGRLILSMSAPPVCSTLALKKALVPSVR